MWLINIDTMELDEFPDETHVRYAILSHRWEGREVSFKDNLARDDSRKEKSYRKVRKCCEQARQDGLSYVWIDTCCIDKSSSAELQEAINSMFRWYSKAVVCYAYLSDVLVSVAHSDESLDIDHSQWFTRGWTLQELVAPREVVFFDQQWTAFGTRETLSKKLSSVTRIETSILERGFPSFESHTRPLICEIMSWAAGRKTTRVEDRAYSLMGLFNVNMPMLYGEGEKAFVRLQEEIIRTTDDQSIMAWQGLLGRAPSCFAESPDQYKPPFERITDIKRLSVWHHSSHLAATNQGISIFVRLVPWRPFVYLALLNVCLTRPNRLFDPIQSCGIFVVPLEGESRYVRTVDDGAGVWEGAIEGLNYPFHSLKDTIDQVTIVRRLSARDQIYVRDHPFPNYGFNVSLHGALSHATTRDHGDWISARSPVEERPENQWLEGQFTLKEHEGTVVSFSIQGLPEVPGLNIQLAFWGNFNPHCSVSFAIGNAFVKYNLTKVDTANFTALSEAQDSQQSRLRVHRQQPGDGEVFVAPVGDETICLRGVDTGRRMPPPRAMIIHAELEIGDPNNYRILSVEVEAPSFEGEGSHWTCTLGCRSKDVS